jgi:glycosyltransferase involved in cell wall biosynthesis
MYDDSGRYALRRLCRVAVALTVYNEENYIANCLKALLGQTFADFEIVIVDDASTDRTRNIILSFDDDRIRYTKNEKHMGRTRSLNRCLSLCDAEHVFFTDGDCLPSKDWIEQGMQVLSRNGCAGVEGRIRYVSENYQPTFSYHVMKNENGGQFMTW